MSQKPLPPPPTLLTTSLSFFDNVKQRDIHKALPPTPSSTPVPSPPAGPTRLSPTPSPCSSRYSLSDMPLLPDPAPTPAPEGWTARHDFQLKVAMYYRYARPLLSADEVVERLRAGKGLFVKEAEGPSIRTTVEWVQRRFDWLMGLERLRREGWNM
ncbi:MAG: hypothetical protein M1824_001720 [Vezdaea acicularis]|nr:MAG: hypothetical protein M1824_001720 [Vezdaea acicularis]